MGAPEVFEVGADGILREGFQKLAGILSGKVKLPKREADVIAEEDSLAAAKARRDALMAEQVKLGIETRAAVEANKGQPLPDGHPLRDSDVRIRFLHLVLIPAARGRVRELEAHARRLADEQSYSDLVEKDPLVKACDAGRRTVERLERDIKRETMLLAGLLVDERGDRIPAPQGGSDERLVSELKVSELRVSKIKATLDYKQAVATYAERELKGKAKRLDLALAEWREMAEPMAGTCDELLDYVEALRKVFPKVQAAGGSVPPFPQAAISALRIYSEAVARAVKKQEVSRGKRK